MLKKATKQVEKIISQFHVVAKLEFQNYYFSVPNEMTLRTWWRLNEI
jgi:hypothetical protein